MTVPFDTILTRDTVSLSLSFSAVCLSFSSPTSRRDDVAPTSVKFDNFPIIFQVWISKLVGNRRTNGIIGFENLFQSWMQIFQTFSFTVNLDRIANKIFFRLIDRVHDGRSASGFDDFSMMKFSKFELRIHSELHEN